MLGEYSEYPFHGRYDRAASILSVVTVPSLKQTSSSAKLVYEVHPPVLPYVSTLSTHWRLLRGVTQWLLISFDIWELLCDE